MEEDKERKKERLVQELMDIYRKKKEACDKEDKEHEERMRKLREDFKKYFEDIDRLVLK